MIKATKPAKPRPDFPLTPHPTGRWCKKIKGRLHYFGPWNDPDGALNRYLDQKDALLAGRKPKQAGNTLADLLNAFLYSKSLRVESGELTQRSFNDYETTSRKVAKSIGAWRAIDSLDIRDFQKLREDLGQGVGLVRLQGELTRARSVFLFANETGLVERLIPYRRELRSPSSRVLRAQRNKRQPRMFERTEITKLIKKASPQLRAMIYLGINCGFGNGDCAKLTFDALDLKGGWHHFPRPKTHNPRRGKLWPETVRAISAAIKVRPRPATDDVADYVFLTRRGACWAKESGKDAGGNAISSEFFKLLDELDLYRERNTFYSLRRTCETIGATASEQVALDFLMGHIPPSSDMSAIYRQRVFDQKLIKVSDRIRGWLLGTVRLR
jgi:integrase